MKRRMLPLWGLVLALLLSACAPAGEEEPAPPPEEAGPLKLESLFLEVPRGDLSAQELARTVRELPEALRKALADRGVEAETVQISVGSSPEATALAAAQGGGLELSISTHRPGEGISHRTPIASAMAPGMAVGAASGSAGGTMVTVICDPAQEAFVMGELAALGARRVNQYPGRGLEP